MRLATTWPTRSGSASAHSAPRRRRPTSSTPSAGGLGLEALGHRPGQRRAVDGLGVERELPGLEPGQVEQVLDQALEAAGLAPDDAHGPGDVVGGAVGDGVGVAPDRRQRGAQLVGHRQQELALETPGPTEVLAQGVDGLGQLRELGVVAARPRGRWRRDSRRRSGGWRPRRARSGR